MKLDRNIEGNQGRGKYAILNLRKLALCEGQGPFEGLHPEIRAAIDTLEKQGILEWGDTPGTDFFLIRLKDEYAKPALLAYAAAAMPNDSEYAHEINQLAVRSGIDHPLCKKPD